MQGDYIWIEPISGREFDVAIGARVISAEGRRIQVKDDDNKVLFNLSQFSTRIEKLFIMYKIRFILSIGDSYNNRGHIIDVNTDRCKKI